MEKALRSLFAVANELAKLARESLPKLRNTEMINHEWLSDGVYYRETAFNGRVYQASFNFKCRQVSLYQV